MRKNAFDSTRLSRFGSKQKVCQEGGLDFSYMSYCGIFCMTCLRIWERAMHQELHDALSLKEILLQNNHFPKVLQNGRDVFRKGSSFEKSKTVN